MTDRSNLVLLGRIDQNLPQPTGPWAKLASFAKSMFTGDPVARGPFADDAGGVTDLTRKLALLDQRGCRADRIRAIHKGGGKGCGILVRDLGSGNNDCCRPDKPCVEGEGDCDTDDDCLGELVCGKQNCLWGDRDDCCRQPGEDEDQALDSCDLLNAAPAYFDAGLLRLQKAGQFTFLSTRNNNFSNRSQKGMLHVLASSRWATILIALVATAATSLLIGASLYSLSLAAATNDSGKLARFLMRCAPTLAPGGWVAEHVVGWWGISQQDDGIVSDPIDFRKLAKDKFRFAVAKHGRRHVLHNIIFVLLNLFFFLLGVILNAESDSVWLAIAKGGGYLLDFLLCLVLFPMMPNWITWLRLTPVGESLIPRDPKILHMRAAKMIAVASALHIFGQWMHWRDTHPAFQDEPLRAVVKAQVVENATNFCGYIAGGVLILIILFSVFRRGFHLRAALAGTCLGEASVCGYRLPYFGSISTAPLQEPNPQSGDYTRSCCRSALTPDGTWVLPSRRECPQSWSHWRCSLAVARRRIGIFFGAEGQSSFAFDLFYLSHQLYIV